VSEAASYAIIAGVIIASVGLWWFWLVLPSVKTMRKTVRFGIYSLVWLAYFILTLIVIGKTS